MSSCVDTILIDNLEEFEGEKVQFLHKKSEEVQSLQDNGNDDVQIVSGRQVEGVGKSGNFPLKLRLKNPTNKY
jgi:hypothetical protein